MKQWTGSKFGKEYDKAVYLTYMQRTSWERLGWMNQAEVKITMRSINNVRYAGDTTLVAES